MSSSAESGSRTINIRAWPVMVSKCSTCPFLPEKDGGLASEVLARTLLKGSQICHHLREHNRKETHLCRGARDVQLTLLAALSLIKEPTDAAFEEATNQVIGGSMQAAEQKVYDSLTTMISEQVGELSADEQRNVLEMVSADVDGMLEALEDEGEEEDDDEVE